MKKYIAVNGASTSGIQTHAKALEWAQKEMSNKTALVSVYICEIVEVAERIAPAIRTRPFEANDFDTEKVAA